MDQSPHAPRPRGGGAYSLNWRPDCLILVDRLRASDRDLSLNALHSNSKSPNVRDQRLPKAAGRIPESEAQFKTLKYRPDFPERFGSIQDARAHCHVFFPWYNTARRHSGLGLLTPHDVHHGVAEQRVAARDVVLAAAYAAHPERFPAGHPTPAAVPTEVWINPPKPRALEEVALTH